MQVWYCQDQNNMEVNEVFTTKKAVVAEVKRIYGKGRFETVSSGEIYWYFVAGDEEPVCTIEKIPLIKASRKWGLNYDILGNKHKKVLQKAKKAPHIV